ncbi:MAG: alpha-amylase [Anaerolinea sp.]|nr:alpha-amylase [Anaerolinea sp.]
MRHHPLIYEINTWVWLTGISRKYGYTITLGNVPPEELDALAAHRFDAVWLMGVWERSPAARWIATQHAGLLGEYAHALPDYTRDEVVGSPYAIHRYQVDGHLGGREGLAHFREELRRRGVRLILDYVPNHVAVDHHWTEDHPDALLRGVEADIARTHGGYYRAANGRIFAHGRDPYFPPWGDTVQINAFSPQARAVTRDTLIEIGQQCDGVRCDMAMLLVNRIFSMTWSLVSNGLPEFWQEVIPAVKSEHPDFLFMAEVYWDMEHELQKLGFDYTYDKLLYDRLLHQGVPSVRDHIMGAWGYQERMVRFIENHDEPRALTSFGDRKIVPAIVLMLTLPGMKLLYEGQLEGRRVKLPVQLGRAPDEPVVEWLKTFYTHALSEAVKPPYHEGVFMMLGMHPLPNEPESSLHSAIIAYCWAYYHDWRIVLVNLSGHGARGRLLLPRPEFRGPGLWRFRDSLNEEDVRDIRGDDVLSSGLIVDMPPYSAKVFHASPL